MVLNNLLTNALILKRFNVLLKANAAPHPPKVLTPLKQRLLGFSGVFVPFLPNTSMYLR